MWRKLTLFIPIFSCVLSLSIFFKKDEIFDTRGINLFPFRQGFEE